MVFVLGQEGMGHLTAEHFLHLSCLKLFQFQGQLANLLLLVDRVLQHLAGTNDVWLKLRRIELIRIQYFLEEVGLDAIGYGCLTPPHLNLGQPHRNQQILDHRKGLIHQRIMKFLDPILDSRVMLVIIVYLQVQTRQGSTQIVLLKLLDVVCYL